MAELKPEQKQKPKPKIDTLVEDIYRSVSEGVDASDIPDSVIEKFKESLAAIVVQRITKTKAETQEEKASTIDEVLRMSSLGEHCVRKLWYRYNMPDVAEPLRPEVHLKFMLGDVWEAVLLFLAEASGHTVEGEQDTLYLHGVPGHRDAVIDGTIVDVKSASTFSYQKFAQPGGLTRKDDVFGYLYQLGAYREASYDDPLVTDKSGVAFLVGDKQHGHITVDYKQLPPKDWEGYINSRREAILDPVIPERGYSDVEDGKSGNRKLGTACSYCAFKHECWPGVRTFLYSSGPRFLTKVVREPNVPEAIPEYAKDSFNGDNAERCGDCGAWCEVVRPGKTQCPRCG